MDEQKQDMLLRGSKTIRIPCDESQYKELLKRRRIFKNKEKIGLHCPSKLLNGFSYSE